MHEAQLYDRNCFLTLTYDDLHLPNPTSLIKHHYQAFMKRLRSAYVPRSLDPLTLEWHTADEDKIRYYMCGEYGDRFERPHYHALLFNFDFDDKVYTHTSDGNRYYQSEKLNALWGKGRCVIGEVTFESACYVARYCTKKITGKPSLDHYANFCPYTGEIYSYREPEYSEQSRKPGVASDWFAKYQGDVFPHDEVIVNGKPRKPPRFYTQRLERDDPGNHEKLRAQRDEQFKKIAGDYTPARLRQRHSCKLAQYNQLQRPLESNNE